MKYKTIPYIATVFFLVINVFPGCKKFVDISPPPTQVTSAKVFENAATAEASVIGLYNRLISGGGITGLTYQCGLSSDEFKSYGQAINLKFETNSLLASDNPGSSFWNEAYFLIFSANSINEELNKSVNIPQNVKTRLISEVKFIRGFIYLYLANIFGEIPLSLTTDYNITAFLPRSSLDSVYAHIIADLNDAFENLPDTYSNYNGERNRVTKWAAAALLSRTYLYLRDWEKADELATAVIDNTTLYTITDLNSVFLANSEEAIWQLSPTSNQLGNTPFGDRLILRTSPSSNDLSLTSSLLADFHEGDKRYTNWINSLTVGSQTYFYPYKYKVSSRLTPNPPQTEYTMVLRLAEQYLIRAEAKVWQNDITSAVQDINKIRTRARDLPSSSVPNPLPDLEDSLSQEDVLMAIEYERRVELFTEWGDRWIDLKRKGRVNEVIGGIKGSNWQASDSLYPIPQTEINTNPNLTQNLGY